MKESVSTSSDSCMDTKGFAMGSNQSLMLLCTRLFFSREWKIIWFIGWMTELKTTKIFSVKSKSIQMLSSYQCFKFISSLTSCYLIEDVIFLKCINAVYVIFFSYRGRADMWCQKTVKRVSVFMTTKKASLWRLWDNKNTYFFLPDGILLSLGHFDNDVILILNDQNPSGFCLVKQIRVFVV